jgi:protein-disulfide isomerase
MSNEPRESKKTTKEKAAAARAAAEAEQRKRDRRVRIIGGVAIAIVVGLIIGIGVYGSRKDSSSSTDPGGIVADAALPTGVFGADNANAWGAPFNTAAGKPTLAIWEDFQCPACGALEKQAGPSIQKLATDGKVNLVWRPTTFLDANFKKTSPNPDSSQRAAAAWGCAIDAGKTGEYHNTVFANQPTNEGDGWTNEQLIDFGKQAGITGTAFDTFTTCVNASTYTQWVKNSYQTFLDSKVAGTPAAFLNGQEVPTKTLLDAAALEKLISDATGS